MKKNADILSLPIISIREGKEIGIVKDLVVETKMNLVSYVVFAKEEEDFMQEYAIPFDAVEGIGDYAMMIGSEDSVIDPRVSDEPEEEVIREQKIIRRGNVLKVTSEIPMVAGVENLSYEDILKYGERSVEVVPQEPQPSRMQQILDSRVGLTSKRALTNKGRLVGVVEYFYFDEENGMIKEYACIRENGKEKKFIAQDIMNIGETVVILKDEVLEEKFSGDIIPMNSFAKKEVKAEAIPEKSASDFLSYFKQNLIGKKVKKDLRNEDGNVFLYKGTEISPEMLDEIEAMGKASLMELLFVV
ncbi:MAG: PRC-barrel domain-containing protein [Peptostreptococcaceae bacterium]|nr:PRC-barrel domain-containing protein [Peptostreptococcaceae bacterium]